ncbi:MAG TPA: PQQ-binding-like beta-propeller repeat protein [Bryobacteraceae bacterium]|nr:PQQ-binding-like beta-propeller repeat protein [Bryobacteraceae bacterium]
MKIFSLLRFPEGVAKREKISAMKRLMFCLIPVFGCLALLAQRPVSWPTWGGDPQRTGWQKSETKLAAGSLSNVRLLWKMKLENEPKALHALHEPLILGNIITPHGFKELAIVAGSDDNIFAIDADLGRIVWKRHFQVPPPNDGRGPHWLCPGGLTATPVISQPAGRGGPPTTPTLYAIASDGMLRQINLANGEDLAPPVPFVPKGNGKPYSLNLVDGVLYTATGQGCGQVPNGVYALNLSDPAKKVSKFETGSGGIWGLAGSAMSTDGGTLYAETGDGTYDPASSRYANAFVALGAKDLKLKDWYAPTNWEWIYKRDLDMNVTPVVFPFHGRDLIAGAGKEGRIYLLDSKSLGGNDHQTPLYRSPLIANEDVNFQSQGIWGALATWEAEGTRWLLAPVWGPKHPEFKYPVTNGGAPQGSIAAFKVEEQGGKTTLTPAWESRDVLSPTPPVIANGIVWALASGEYTQQSKLDASPGLYSSEDRAKLSSKAILYALDAKTGKELWSSGSAMNSFTHYYGLALANGRVYVGTYDGTFYCFGVPMEH